MEAAGYEREEFRICTEQDLDAVMDLQELVCRTLDNDEIFVPTSREENATYLHEPNRILGAFYDGQLAAYGSLVCPGLAEDNYGWQLGWPAEKVKRCVKVDTVVVNPAFRGRGLQRRLVRMCTAMAEAYLPEVILLTTVSPHNPYSLRNMQAEGFEILLRTAMYGGCERFILGFQPGRGSSPDN